MSEEHVEIVQGFEEEYRRGDLEALSRRYDPAVAVVSWMGSRHEGVDAVMDSMREWLREWEWFTTEVQEIIELDDGRVVVISRFRGKGKQSGVETDWLAGEIWTFREGRIANVINYPSVEAALEAASVER